MADPTQFDLLRRSVVEWNAWRVEYSYMKVDLSDLNLSGADLREVDLSEADLSGTDLRGTNLSHANLSNIRQHISLGNINLSGADLSRANLSHAYLSHAYLSQADLSGANLSHAELSHADLSYADASEADFSYADASEADFSFTTLNDAHLNNSIFNIANLSHANLIRADFSRASLVHTHLGETDLRGADFSFTSIGWTSFGDCDLRMIKGLETMIHVGPSFLSINSIYLSAGELPEAFVRGTGAPDTFLEYMHALTSRPIEYYTCFISYSSKDQSFAERLYADLQHNGVRCWFAPHNMRPGTVIVRGIDEAIRLYDKLLLVISQHSVESTWVEFEVAAALEKEKDQQKDTLFPIRLDDTILTTKQAWAAGIRRQRHIGDFTQWKNHDAYQQTFERLLRDLKQGKV